MKIKRTISIRTLLILIAIVASVLSLDRFVESKAIRFVENSDDGKIQIDVSIDGKVIQVSDVPMTGSTDITRWYDKLLFRRKHELRYDKLFISEGYWFTKKYKHFVVSVSGPPKQIQEFDMLINP